MNPAVPPPYGKIDPNSQSSQNPGIISYGYPVQGQGQQYGYVNGCSQIMYTCQPPYSTTYEKFRHVQAIILSILQILIGVACIALNAALIGVLSDGNHYEDSIFSVVGHGIWGGVFFIVAGCLGIGAAKTKSKCLVISFMVLCILSAVVAATVFSLGMVGCFTSYYSDTLGLNITMTVLAAIEGAIAIWGSVLCCAVACCGASSTVYVGPGGQPVQVVPIAGGQQVYVVTSPPINPQYAPYSGNPGQFVVSAPVHPQ